MQKWLDYFFRCDRIQTQYNRVNPNHPDTQQADKNAFSGFDVFRNLPFEREQVELFIRR